MLNFRSILFGAAFAALMCIPAKAQEVQGPPEISAPPPAETRQEREQRNWNKVKPLFVANTAIHILDGITTSECSKMHRRDPRSCFEKNSLYGSRDPSLKTIIAIKGATIVGSYFISREASKIEPLAGVAFLTVSGAFTGKLVVGNIRIVW